jgi:hypothetical protein
MPTRRPSESIRFRDVEHADRPERGFKHLITSLPEEEKVLSTTFWAPEAPYAYLCPRTTWESDPPPWKNDGH